MKRGALSGTLLVVLIILASQRIGPLPPLGPLLDPVNGVWALATIAELSEREELQIPGLSAPVEIVFDDRGVPHIFASTSADAAQALGYVVARDRLFQLEFRWRVTAGRISEMVGAAALSSDRYLRRLGLAWSAERDFAALDPASPVAREIAAYADGVNAWIDQLGRRDLPLEYRLLGAKPSPWEPAYSLYLIKLMGWDLTFAVTNDLRRLRLQARVGREAADALLPVNSPIQEPIQPNGSEGPRFDFRVLPPPGEIDRDAAQIARTLERALGPLALEASNLPEPTPWASNNWVVAPERTAAGYALLAGDPHLGLTLPSIWYEAHIVVPGDLDVYGVTLPALPLIVLGFNRDVAWSMTNTGADIIDYYEEELDDREHPTRYRLDGEWRPLELRIESFRGVDGEELATDTIYHTHRGPMVSDDGRWLSMRWLVLEESGQEESLRAAARATSVEEWLGAMEEVSTPAQNVVLADRQGTVAIRSNGKYPLHPDGSGLEVRPGNTSASDWVGFWPLQEYPFSLNPEQGYLASTNQQPIDPEVDDTYLGSGWPAPWRAMRINQLLRADSAVTPEAMRRYQTDPGNARADLFVPFFLGAVAGAIPNDENAAAREATRLLGEWDRRYTKGNDRAVLFEYAMNELVRRTWDELEVTRDDGRRRRVATPSTAVLASLLHQPDSEWWDDRATDDRKEERDAVLIASLGAALERARADHGEPDEGGWRWDGIRHANIYHLLRFPSLSALDLPIQGGPGTLNPSSGSGTHGASWRMVVELGPEMSAWSIYPGGQSGNPASSRYDDRIQKWVEGELDPVLFPRRPADIDPGRVTSVLSLSPRR